MGDILAIAMENVSMAFFRIPVHRIHATVMFITQDSIVAQVCIHFVISNFKIVAETQCHCTSLNLANVPNYKDTSRVYEINVRNELCRPTADKLHLLTLAF